MSNIMFEELSVDPDAKVDPTDMPIVNAILDTREAEWARSEVICNDAFIADGTPLKKRPVMTYVNPTNSGNASENGYFPLEYDVREIYAAEDTESLVFQTILKKVALAFKGAITLTGKNEAALKYIKRRFKEVEIAQEQSMYRFFAECFASLVRTHMCIIIKSRDIDTSSGAVRTYGNKEIQPVAGYFIASPETMSVSIDSKYRIRKWQHKMPDGRYAYIPRENVIFITVNKRPHMIAPTPPWAPVIGDIKALRSTEDNVLELIDQHAAPVYQYKIGTDKSPMRRFQDGTTEADQVSAKLRQKPPKGFIFTPERHQIVSIAENKSIKADPYLGYFHKRVIAGTGLSEIDFGEGGTANRNTADSMSRLGTANVKFLLNILADAINTDIIREMMYESNFVFDVLDEENEVKVAFDEIDLDAQIQLENHLMLLYGGDYLTRTEARARAGWSALTEEQEDDTAAARKAIAAEETLKAQAKYAPTPAPVASSSTSKTSSSMKSATNKSMPKNQYGTKSGPGSKKDFLITNMSGAVELFEGSIEDLHTLVTTIGSGIIDEDQIIHLCEIISDGLLSNIDRDIIKDVVAGTIEEFVDE